MYISNFSMSREVPIIVRITRDPTGDSIGKSFDAVKRFDMGEPEFYTNCPLCKASIVAFEGQETIKCSCGCEMTITQLK